MALSLFPHEFDEVRIFDGKLDDFEFMKKIIALDNVEDPFRLWDVMELVRKNRTWVERIPRVVPHYAVKYNPNPGVIKTLAALGASFDCSSKQEIMTVMAYGVPAERIILANPVKTPTQIRYAQQVGVSKMAVDNMWELRKIREFYTDAKIIIRLRADPALGADAFLGCDPGDEAVRLIRSCRDLGLELHGFSFNVSNPSCEVLALSRGIGHCKHLIDVARSIGFHDVQLIAIGGGSLPAGSDLELDRDEVWSYFSRLQKYFVFKDLLFQYRHLVFWLGDYYRTNWSYSRVKKVTYKRTSTASRTTLALPW